jgi:hypothetical protein
MVTGERPGPVKSASEFGKVANRERFHVEDPARDVVGKVAQQSKVAK